MITPRYFQFIAPAQEPLYRRLIAKALRDAVYWMRKLGDSPDRIAALLEGHAERVRGEG